MIAFINEKAQASSEYPHISEIEFKLWSWISAALDDTSVCEEFKQDIKAWFDEINSRKVVKVQNMDEVFDSFFNLKNSKI